MEKEAWYKIDIESRAMSKKMLIKFQLWKLVEFFLFKPSLKFLKSYRVFLLRIFGAKIGDRCYISPSVSIVKPWELSIGNDCSIDDYTYIVGRVTIGDYVRIANHVKIYGGQHVANSRKFESIMKPIVIGNGVFLGGGAIVLPDVTIGQMALVAAGTVIDKSVPENKIIMEVRKYVKIDRIDPEIYNNYRYNSN